MKSFFISSTFKDMQAERDILHEQIFPRLRTLLKSYGEEVQEVDLRWGVDTVNMTEEESGYEVLRICIDAIDRCKPYLVVLLGERYGWIPGTKIVHATRDTRISDRYEEEMSITELEIQYGALLNQEAFSKCVFCFRDKSVMEKIPEGERAAYYAESEHHALRLAALKKQIRSKPDAVILDYTADWDEETGTICGLDAFAQQLHAMLERMILADLAGKENKSLMQRYADESDMIRDGYLSTYIRRYPEEFMLCKKLQELQFRVAYSDGRKIDCLLVSGDAGSGKSALMAYMASSIPKLKDNTILCFAAASGCRDVSTLKRFIAYRLETLLQEPHQENPKSLDELLRMLNKKAAGRGITCFVDGLDQIYHGQQSPYIDLPILCPDVIWVFSALPDFPMEKAAADFHYETVYVDRLHPDQRNELIRATAGKRGKKLDGQLVKEITECAGAGNPLFLSLVLQRFFMMNKEEFEAAEAIAPGMEGLHRYMSALMEEMPDLPNQMAVYILNVTAKLFDQDQFQEVLMLIAESQSGLTEKELEEILALAGKRFSQVKFQQIVSYLYDAFSQRSNGKWTFSHRLFGEAVQQTMTDGDRERIRDLLVRYSLEDADFMAQEGFHYLLERRHPGFAKALSACETWSTKAELMELVGRTAKEEPLCRDFLEELACSAASDEMAGFWLAFDDYLYGKDVEKMAGRIVGALLEAPLSPAERWQLALRRLYDVEKPEMLPLIQQAEEFAALLPDPARTIALASIYARRGQVQTGLRYPYEQVLVILKKAMACVESAMEQLDGQGRWKDYVTLLESVHMTADEVFGWQEPEAVELWHRGLELVEQLDRFSDEQVDDYTYWKIRFLYCLCDAYCERQTRDYEKAKLYGNQALELAEIVTSQRPTVRNLENRINALKAYTRWMKREYQNPYWQQAMECARKLYASAKTNQYKRMLAANEAEYAISYFDATRAGTLQANTEQKKEVKEVFAHSCQLFEELIADDYYHTQLVAYGSFLAEWTMICVNDTQELNAALEYGKKSMQRLEQRRQRVQADAAAEKRPEHQKYYDQQLGWLDGWTGRLKEAMATAYQLQLNSEACERYAREALELNLKRSKQYSAYYREALNSAIKVAVSCYQQRKDDEALAACDRFQQLVEAPEAERYDCRTIKAEMLYVRGRIALERGDVDAAWNYLCQSEELTKLTMLADKLLILKADCLQVKQDPGAEDAWRAALEAWRKRLKSQLSAFEEHARGRKIMRPYWAENRVFAQTVYYTAYCHHHCVLDRKDIWDNNMEREFLYAISYTDKGWLKGRPVPNMKVETRTVSTYQGSYVCSDFADFVEKLNAMTDWEKPWVDPAVHRVILENIEKFPDAVPDREQYNTLNGITRIFYDQLRSDRALQELAVNHSELLQWALPIQGELPVYEIRTDWNGDKCEIWPKEYLESIPNCWYAMMKLLLLMLRRDSILNRKTGIRLRSVYRVVSEKLGGSEEIEKTDLSFLTNRELAELLDSYNMEWELGIHRSNIYWYAMKNIWIAELYHRSRRTDIIDRLQTFEKFLTEPYLQQYEQMDCRYKLGMPQELANAAAHLARVLRGKGENKAALAVIRWSESVPELAGKLKSETIYSLRPETEEERRWLEDVKLRYCRKWMENAKDGLASVRYL